MLFLYKECYGIKNINCGGGRGIIELFVRATLTVCFCRSTNFVDNEYKQKQSKISRDNLQELNVVFEKKKIVEAIINQ